MADVLIYVNMKLTVRLLSNEHDKEVMEKP